MNKIKVGDSVKCLLLETNGSYFENVLQVEEVEVINKRINTEWNCFVNGSWYSMHVLELVCNFVKGQMIEVSNNKYFNNPSNVLFNQYRPELEKTFECVMQDSERKFENNGLYNINTWKYARAIQPVYTPYEEFDYNMLDTELKVQDTNMEYIILGYMFDIKTGDVLLQKTCGIQCIAKSLTDLCECFTRVDDGTPFGELNKT